jgi:nucleoporin GLE1
MALKEALDGKVPSAPIEVNRFIVGQRQPVEGAPNNDTTLPSLFIYLLNICAKGIINQFINECSANPKAADPIGVFTAHIFSQKDFLWRGESLIDILMAKFRVVCPVLFGLRGSDKTERGRLAIGWKKDGPGYVTEQTHNDRMTGLGAGFASISLRDFSKTSKANPYPPVNYWKALAGIVNSPPNETSNTQYVVLRAMIEGHEQRFLNFYGNAAIAALRLALVDFPKRAPANASAAHSLRAMVELLRTDGLVLS